MDFKEKDFKKILQYPMIGDTVSHFHRDKGWVVRKLPSGSFSIAYELGYASGLTETDISTTKMVLTEIINPVFLYGTNIPSSKREHKEIKRYKQ
jgi:hypothetical protein